MLSARDTALGTLSRVAPRAPLSHHSRLLRARPPSLHIGSPCDSHTGRRCTLLWVRLPPNDFCNFTFDARTHSRTSDSRVIELPRFAVASTLPSLSRFLYGIATFPSRRRIASAANRDNPSDADPTDAASVAVTYDPGNYRPIVTPLAGDALIRPPLAVMAVGRQRWTARAETP